MHFLPLPNAPSAASCQRPASRSSLVTFASHFHADRSTSVATNSELSSSSRRDALLAMSAAVSSLVLTGPVRGQEEAQVGGTGTVTSTSSNSLEVRCTPVIYRPLLWRGAGGCLASDWRMLCAIEDICHCCALHSVQIAQRK